MIQKSSSSYDTLPLLLVLHFLRGRRGAEALVAAVVAVIEEQGRFFRLALLALAVDI